MRNDGGVWRSSFIQGAGPESVIDDGQSVLTVLSGSSGAGGHASMYLEMMKDGEPVSKLIDLTAGGGKISILNTNAQIIKNADQVINLSLPKGGDPTKLSKAHRHCYHIDAATTEKVIAAAERFKDKAAGGRYVYRVAGGAVGYLTSKPGTRGVNCADFVIKILREAGIRNIAYLLFDSPYRIAK